MTSFLTLNTFLLDIRLLGVPLYPSAPHLAARLAALPGAVRALGADVVCLQEVFRKPHRAFLAAAVSPLPAEACGKKRISAPFSARIVLTSGKCES